MKSILRITFFLFLFQSIGFAQDSLQILKFDTKYYDALDKWVAFPKSEKDSTHILGFVYLDQTAGFTLRVGNSFKTHKNQLISREENFTETTLMIYRLEPNTMPVAVLNTEQLIQLKLDEIPDWLENYQSNKGTVDYLKNTGYHLNHVGGSEKALEPLLQAYEIDPEYEGLAFELGFAYNATGQFDKAIPVLEKAIKNNNDELLYKELGYALINLKDVNKSEKVYTQGIKHAKTRAIKAEMAINMCSLLLHVKNKEKLKEWLVISESYIDKNSQYQQHLNYFKAEITKLD